MSILCRGSADELPDCRVHTASRGHVGLESEEPRTTQQIAEQTQVPSGYLSKVLKALGRAGVVEAQRGLYGGFILARPLNELTILDVINAVDPLERIERCPLGIAAHGDRLCPLHRRLDQGIAEMEALFKGTTIGELLAEQETSQPMCVLVAHGKSPARS
jgi:Rrf2 family protein